jgi:hypothetical protein
MITLPHSGLTVPHTNLRVTALREVQHAHGVSYTAVLQLGERVVGVAENDGHGGDTVFYARPGQEADAFAERDMENFAAQCRAGGEPVYISDVLDCLINEYDLARLVADAATRGRTLARMLTINGSPFTVVEVDPPTTERQRDVLIAHLDTEDLPAGARWEVWDGQRWTVLIQAPSPEETPHKRTL